MLRCSIVALTISVGVAVSPAAAQEWGCYDPKPGHPTVDEKKAFISSVSQSAIRGEQQHGVPAAAIAAMSMIESGYGWTRIALEAQNYFGWKYYGPAAAEGRDQYTLTCQPPEDINNKYVKFLNLDDAVNLVARKLATLPAYKSDTQYYQESRARGVDNVTATNTWVSGIANPYNWKPELYATTVRRFMNNPENPSETVSPELNLYRLSERAGRHADAGITSEDLPGYKYAVSKVKAWSGSCGDPILDYTRWEGFPVRKCRVSDLGVTVETYMLNADSRKISLWIATACKDAGVLNTKACIDHLVAVTKGASSMGIFPVAGYIPESYNGVCNLFRDGVTVKTATWSKQIPPINGACGPESELTNPLTSARKFARISSTSREDYRLAGGKEPVGEDGNVHWADVIRALYQAAWNSPRNQLISARAIADKKRGIIR